MKKRISKIIAFMLSATIIISGLANLSFSAFTVTAEETNTNTPDGYIPIYTSDDFNNIRDNLDGCYILMNDISFQSEDFQEGGAYYNDGIGWFPIGSEQFPFTGCLDGNGYTVSGIDTTWTDEDYATIGLYVGIFGVNNGVIKNLSVDVRLDACSEYETIVSPGFTNEPYLGTISGYNDGEIIDCHVFSLGYHETIYRGGIVGVNSGKIFRCVNDGISTQARLKAGGISIVNSGIIQECVNQSTVRTAWQSPPMGGLTSGGISALNTSIIKDSYNTGAVKVLSSNTYYPDHGLASGITFSDENGEVINCYNIGLVEALYNNPISNSFKYSYAWDIKNVNNNESYRTIEEMKIRDTFKGFDFDETWEMSKDTAYPFPVLRNVSVEQSKRLTAVYISKMPSRTVFVVKENIDLSDGEWTEVYSDGSVQVRSFGDNDVSTNWTAVFYDLNYNFQIVPESFLSAGTYKVIIYMPWASGISMSPITLEAVDKKELIGVTITPPNKKVYLKGEEIDLTGMYVTGIYNTQQQEIISNYTVTGYDSMKTGKQTITVSCGDFVDSFEIEIIDYLPGDLNEDGKVDGDDAAYLLKYTFYPKEYPIKQNCDFNSDGKIDSEDVSYLLYHTFYPDEYPLLRCYN